MSFSNADTGSKPADQYKDKNMEQPALKEKVQDLVAFIEKTKFAMMTTKVVDGDLLVSRCMALAATVCNAFQDLDASTLVYTWLILKYQM